MVTFTGSVTDPLTINTVVRLEPTATIRDRDSMEQEVVAIDELQNYLIEKING